MNHIALRNTCACTICTEINVSFACYLSSFLFISLLCSVVIFEYVKWVSKRNRELSLTISQGKIKEESRKFDWHIGDVVADEVITVTIHARMPYLLYKIAAILSTSENCFQYQLNKSSFSVLW